MAYRGAVVQSLAFPIVLGTDVLLPLPTVGSIYLVRIKGVVTAAGGLTLDSGSPFITIPATAPVGATFYYSYGDGLRLTHAISAVDIGGGRCSLTLEYYVSN